MYTTYKLRTLNKYILSKVFIIISDTDCPTIRHNVIVVNDTSSAVYNLCERLLLGFATMIITVLLWTYQFRNLRLCSCPCTCTRRSQLCLCMYRRSCTEMSDIRRCLLIQWSISVYTFVNDICIHEVLQREDSYNSC